MDAIPDIDETLLRGRAGFATVEIHPQLGSTMNRAREIAADDGAALPAVVVADVQTAGHGRRGARWWQAPGSLAASIVLDERAAAAPIQPTWSLACGIAVAESIAAIEPTVKPLLRWPNDLELAGRKVAGLLLETAGNGRAILGIGVNTTGTIEQAPEPIRDRLTTLPDLTGRSLPRGTLLAEFLPRFLDLVRRMHDEPEVLVDRYRGRCSLDGRPVTVFRGAERVVGTCRGVAIDGSLVVDTPAGRQWITSGSLTDPADVWMP